MNTPTTTPNNPVADSQPGDDTPFHLVAVKIRIPETPIVLPGYPERNLIGAKILFATLEAALTAENLRINGAPYFCVGSLNDSYYGWCVSAVAPALAALETILEAAILRNAATLLVYDAAEGFFRPQGPDNARIGAGFTMAAVMQQNEADGKYTEFMKYILALLTPKPQTPPAVVYES